ncbi:MAG: type I-E CRISPR-associated protein Cse2/CasB [Acidimicrobiales bacterium]
MTGTATTAADIGERFVGRLDKLVTRADRARLAALRQLVGPEDRWGPDAYATAYPLLPAHLHPNDERRLLVVAGLHALWHQGKGVPAAHSGESLGKSMRVMATGHTDNGELPPAAERRFAVLLASEDERLTHHLRQAITQLSSDGTNVDFAVLFADLHNWDHPDRSVQRRWARAFWTSSPLVSDRKESV